MPRPQIRALLRCACAPILSLLLLAVPGAALAQAQAPGVAAFDAYMDGVERFADAVDRTAFDLEALSLATALSAPGDIVEAVRARVGFQPYAGSLRGAAGALSAGAGNSLDVALLLARLLGDSGQETRIALATLDAGQVTGLLARSGPAAPVPPFRDAAAAEDALAAMEQASGGRGIGPAISAFLQRPDDSIPSPDVTMQEAQRAIEILGDALPAPAPLDAVLRAEAAQYFWVQSRRFGGEDWVDRHVLLPADADLRPEGFVPVPLPATMQHHIALGVELWVRDGTRTRRERLFNGVDFLSAEMPGMAPVLSIVPDAALKGQPDLALAAPDSRFFFPLLNGVLPQNARAFTPRGLLVPAADVLTGGASADLVAAVGAKVSESSDLFAGLPSSEKEEAALPPNSPVQEILGLILTVTHTPPEGGTRQVWERYIVDRVGAARRADGQITGDASALPAETAVLGRWTLVTAVGGLRPAELVSAQADRAGDLREVLRPAAEGQAVYAFPAVNPVQAMLTIHLLDAAAARGAGAAAQVYRAAPGLMLVRQTSTPLEGGTKQAAGIDILTTGRRALDAAGRADPAAALRAGVAETLMEHEMALSIVPGAAPRPVPTDSGWTGMLNAGDLRVASRANDLPDSLSPAVRAAAEADLRAGNILALALPSLGGDAAAWWRIDPLSGATIGVDALGRGGEAAEYLSLVDAIITGTFIGVGTASCTAGGGSYGCCVATNMAWGMLGYGVLFGASKGIEMLFLADAYMAGAIGMATGVGMSASGWNPMTGACS